jgi:hypothetical protein
VDTTLKQHRIIITKTGIIIAILGSVKCTIWAKYGGTLI